MRKSLTLIIAACALLFASISANATITSGTVTSAKVYGDPSDSFQIYEYDFISDSSGNVTYQLEPSIMSGEILYFETDPGSTAPTDNWDVTLTAASGYDMLVGLGANRDTSYTERITFNVQGNVVAYATPTIISNNSTALQTGYVAYVHGNPSINVTNAGASKTLTIRIAVRK